MPVALLPALLGCKAKAEPAASSMPPPEVAVARIVARESESFQDFTGRLEAVNTVEVRPRVSGHIDAVHFTEGARIKKGQLLFSIDARPFRLEVERLEAERRRAESQAAFAKLSQERGTRLVKSGAISQSEFDQIESGDATAAAALDSTRAALGMARLDLAFTRIHAPIDGRVSRALVTSGNLVSPESVLTTLVSDGSIYVYFDVDEATYLTLSKQDAAARVVKMGLVDEDGYPHDGTLDFVDNRVDPSTGTARARARFANEDGRLVPGLFARVRLMSGTAKAALLVDDKAVLTDQDRKYVYVLDEKGRAQRKNVVLGPVVDGLRIARDGLSAEDRVIVYGVQKVMFPGMPVKPSEIAMGAPPPDPAAGTPAG